MALNVLITSREEKVFDGSCTSITSINELGEFDVLEGHANFITLIKDYVVLDKGSENELRTDILSGVLRCIGNKIDVYVQLSENYDPEAY